MIYAHYFGGEETIAFDNLEFWGFILAIGLILACLLLANILIQTIKPLKKALLPSPVLGGFILLIVLSVYKAIAGEPMFSPALWDIITYHGLGIGFVATALKRKTKTDEEVKKKGGAGIFNSSLVTVGGYLVQAVVGILVSILFFVILKDGFPAAGALLPMGFGQGPGQALNWGLNYQNLTSETSAFAAFANGKSFGLAIAALGFISSSIGGLIYIGVQKKKGNVKFVGVDGEDVPKDTLETFTSNNEIPHSGTIDKLSVQLALVFITYLISFGIIYLISKGCDASGVKLLINTVKPLFWGFNFIIGTAVAAGIRAIINVLEKKGICKRQVTNNYMMDRISGVAFDIMVVAAIGSINLEAFGRKEFILPLVVMGVLGCAVTFIYCNIVCKHLFANDGYYEESFLSLFGMLTGTASTGVILLREIDPAFKTPACNNMVYQTLWSVALGAPVLLLMSFLAQGWGQLWAAVGIFAVYFVVIMLLIFRDKVFKKKAPKAEEVKE